MTSQRQQSLHREENMFLTCHEGLQNDSCSREPLPLHWREMPRTTQERDSYQCKTCRVQISDKTADARKGTGKRQCAVCERQVEVQGMVKLKKNIGKHCLVCACPRCECCGAKSPELLNLRSAEIFHNKPWFDRRIKSDPQSHRPFRPSESFGCAIDSGRRTNSEKQ